MSKTVMLVHGAWVTTDQDCKGRGTGPWWGGLGEIPNLHSRGPEPDIKLARLVGR
jgi:hypothetical protein